MSALTARLLVLALLMAGTSATAARMSRPDAAPAHEPLAAFPLAVEGWRGRDLPAPPPDPGAAGAGADEAIDRHYIDGASAVALYVGYYASQRQGDSVHSPLNCLPGTGWVPIESDYLAVPRGAAGERVTVRRLRVRRGSDEALVLYWYQGRGRVVASEYWSKAYLMYDAARRGRTDTALVRVFSLVDERTDGVRRAERDLVAFVRAALPLLDRLLPL